MNGRRDATGEDDVVAARGVLEVEPVLPQGK
jgi:hypothetical protein